MLWSIYKVLKCPCVCVFVIQNPEFPEAQKTIIHHLNKSKNENNQTVWFFDCLISLIFFNFFFSYSFDVLVFFSLSLFFVFWCLTSSKVSEKLTKTIVGHMIIILFSVLCKCHTLSNIARKQIKVFWNFEFF